MTKKVSALNFQQDGDHYKTLKMQPLELAYRVNGSPCFTKLAKYASRKKVDRLGDLKKAIHCIQLEQELVSKYGNPYKKVAINSGELKESLDLFTDFKDNPKLWGALFDMYRGYYDDAIDLVKAIIHEEFPDEA